MNAESEALWERIKELHREGVAALRQNDWDTVRRILLEVKELKRRFEADNPIRGE